jgi:hypothetical protein
VRPIRESPVLPAREPWQLIGEPSQLHPNARSPRLRAPLEDPQHEVGAVDDFEPGFLGQVALLHTAQLTVDDEHRRAMPHGVLRELTDLALAEQRARVGAFAILQARVRDRE